MNPLRIGLAVLATIGLSACSEPGPSAPVFHTAPSIAAMDGAPTEPTTTTATDPAAGSTSQASGNGQLGSGG